MLYHLVGSLGNVNGFSAVPFAYVETDFSAYGLTVRSLQKLH